MEKQEFFLRMRVGIGFNADLPVPQIMEKVRAADALGFES